MNTKEQLLSVYVQEVFFEKQDLILSKSNIIFDTVELYYLDNCGREYRINENPTFTKINEGYKISFKGQKRNLSYLVKYFHLIKKHQLNCQKMKQTHIQIKTEACQFHKVILRHME